MPQNRLRHCKRQRQGTIYAIVLLSSLLVATIGLSSLQIIRLQSRTANDNADFMAARAYARAAIEIGMLKIHDDPTWRVRFGNGDWVTDKPIDLGTYSISANDPIDNDVTQGNRHPVILTGTGKKGAARFIISTRLETGPRVNSCLDVAMISNKATTVTGSTLSSDQWVSSNFDFTANSSSINADVEFAGKLKGSTYNRTTLENPTLREMPAPARVLDYYLANGTTIPLSALTQWGSNNLIANSGFELNTSGWRGTVLTFLNRVNSPVKQGLYSLRVSRLLNSGAAVTDLPVASLQRGHTYHLSMPIYAAVNGTVQGVLTLTSSGDGVQTYTTPAFSVSSSSSAWVEIAADFTPTWTGDLTSATLSTTTSFRNEYYLDAVSLIDTTYPTGSYVLDGKLLSPTSNPFGMPNPQGIYIVACNNNNVVVGNSRMVGTLVLIDAGSSSMISNGVCMEAAIANFPALLTNKSLTIKLGSGGLSENELGVNFNPSGTPYPFLDGASNATISDFYPSKISGLVYSAKDLVFTDACTLAGVVIADTSILLNSAGLTINYNNIYSNDPPPGFDVGEVQMKITPGTWQRIVN